MRIKKRKKSTRYRGSQTHRRGHRKRTRGLGNQGGKGMSGSENQKKSLILNKYGIKYFGKDKTLRRGKLPSKLKVISLDDLILRFDSLLKQGIAKQSNSLFEFNLKGFKVLGSSGAFNAKISVIASAASKSAIEKIKAAGGTIEIEHAEAEKKVPNRLKKKAPLSNTKS
ncbi:MAG: uL15 family ribosomal protein [Candidatus Pacearchaeota archaeon]